MARVWWYLLLKRELRTDVVSRVDVPPPDENMYVDRLLPTLWLTTSSTTTQRATFTADASDGAAQPTSSSSLSAPNERTFRRTYIHKSPDGEKTWKLRLPQFVRFTTTNNIPPRCRRHQMHNKMPDTSQLRPLVIHADACHRVRSTRITWYPRSKCH